MGGARFAPPGGSFGSPVPTNMDIAGTANHSSILLGFWGRTTASEPPRPPVEAEMLLVAKQPQSEPRSCSDPATPNLAAAPSAQNFSLGYQAVFHPGVISPAQFMFIVD